VQYDPVLGRLLWSHVQTVDDRNAKGRLFEYLVGYLFETLGHYEVRSRVIGLASEHDLLVRSGTPDEGLHRELGSYLLVECKNQRDAVGSRDVRAFAGNVRYASCRSGVLASTSGISGRHGAGVENAEYVVRTVYHRDGTILLVLGPDAIDAVVTENRTLLDVLTELYEAIRFDLRPP
jgi:Restriction endonuclease